MPRRRRVIFVFVKMYGFSIDEIAELLHLTREGVRSHLVRALQWLRAEARRDRLAFDADETLRLADNHMKRLSARKKDVQLPPEHRVFLLPATTPEVTHD